MAFFLLKREASLLPAPHGWLSFSPHLKQRPQPLSWKSHFRLLVSMILLFWSWPTLHDHTVTSRSKSFPFWFNNVVPLCGTILILKPISCSIVRSLETLRCLKSHTWGKDSFIDNPAESYDPESHWSSVPSPSHPPPKCTNAHLPLFEIYILKYRHDE